MKMVAVVGRRAWMVLSLACAVGLSTLGPSAFAATAKLSADEQSKPFSTVATHRGDVTDRGPGDAKVTASAEVVVLLGTNDGTGFDPKIEKMPPALKTALKKPPLSAYNSYKVLERFEAQLDKGAVVTHKLKQNEDDVLSVTLKDIVKAKSKYVLTMSIAGPTVNLPSLEVNASQDDYFFVVAPQKVQGGAMVIGVRILP